MSFDIKFTRLGFENTCWITRQASRCQQAFSKALPGKLDIKRHSPSILYVSFQLTFHYHNSHIQHSCLTLKIMTFAFCAFICSCKVAYIANNMDPDKTVPGLDGAKKVLKIENDQLNYLSTKETWHILCVHFLVVNEYNAHLSSHCVKLNKSRQKCTEIIWKDELISDVRYQKVTLPLKSILQEQRNHEKFTRNSLSVILCYFIDIFWEFK